jgi:hypothetical protein
MRAPVGVSALAGASFCVGASLALHFLSLDTLYRLCNAQARCLCIDPTSCWARPMTALLEVSETPPRVLRQRTGSRYDHGVPAPPRKTPQRTVAVEKDDWDELAIAARQAGYERAVVLRAFIRWYLRRPGAKLPQRPGD